MYLQSTPKENVMQSKTTTVVARVSPKSKRRYISLAKKYDMSLADLIRRLLDQELELSSPAKRATKKVSICK